MFVYLGPIGLGNEPHVLGVKSIIKKMPYKKNDFTKKCCIKEFNTKVL